MLAQKIGKTKTIIEIQRVIVLLFLVLGAAVPAFSDEPQKSDDMTPKKKMHEFEHICVMGYNRTFSKGTNKFAPIIAYNWFGDNTEDRKPYLQFTLTTTRIFMIAAIRTDRVFAGIKPLFEHTSYSSWRSFNRGYNDSARSIGGNNAGGGVFFQYAWSRIFSTKLTFDASYYFYRLFLLAKNEHKYPNLPNRHVQVMPGIELLLRHMKEKNLGRIKHGFMIRGEYQYARRIGYGTWYDYDRLWYHEKLHGLWTPTTGMTEGVWYKSTVKDTHRIHFNVGLYYAFAHDINVLLDCYGGYSIGVDRNNAEQIGNMNHQKPGIMPGYANTEFYHHLYTIARLQFGFPLPFWNARIQAGYNALYMPRKNEVVGQGRGLLYFGSGAVLTDAISKKKIGYHGYPRRFYTSVSCLLSLQLGNLLPLFVDYAYGIDTMRASSAHDLYLNRFHRGCHELGVYMVMAFGHDKR